MPRNIALEFHLPAGDDPRLRPYDARLGACNCPEVGAEPVGVLERQRRQYCHFGVNDVHCVQLTPEANFQHRDLNPAAGKPKQRHCGQYLEISWMLRHFAARLLHFADPESSPAQRVLQKPAATPLAVSTTHDHRVQLLRVAQSGHKLPDPLQPRLHPRFIQAGKPFQRGGVIQSFSTIHI